MFEAGLILTYSGFTIITMRAKWYHGGNSQMADDHDQMCGYEYLYTQHFHINNFK